MNERFEILSALVDGEAVDPAELERTLALPGARRALVELADLRRAFAAERARPRERFAERARAALGDAERARARRWPWAVLAAAAALALVLLLPPRASMPSEAGLGPPPPAERVLRFEPGVDWTTVGPDGAGVSR